MRPDDNLANACMRNVIGSDKYEELVQHVKPGVGPRTTAVGEAGAQKARCNMSVETAKD